MSLLSQLGSATRAKGTGCLFEEVGLILREEDEEEEKNLLEEKSIN